MFNIYIKDIYWNDKTLNNTKDLCAHGDLTVKLSDQVYDLENITLSSTGFYLLKSLEKDHIINHQSSKMFPKCGENFRVNRENGEIMILGCDKGLDISIVHTGGRIIIKDDSNNFSTLTFKEYKDIVFEFTNRVEDFYNSSLNREIPDSTNGDSFLGFLDEWNNIKTRVFYY